MGVGDYLPKACGLCQGKGQSSRGQPCGPCGGKGTVLVLQPPRRCPRCSGSGLPTAADHVYYDASLCLVCGGAGWVLTSNQAGGLNQPGG